jgi:hypothetical protein
MLLLLCVHVCVGVCVRVTGACGALYPAAPPAPRTARHGPFPFPFRFPVPPPFFFSFVLRGPADPNGPLISERKTSAPSRHTVHDDRGRGTHAHEGFKCSLQLLAKIWCAKNCVFGGKKKRRGGGGGRQRVGEGGSVGIGTENKPGVESCAYVLTKRRKELKNKKNKPN